MVAGGRGGPRDSPIERPIGLSQGLGTFGRKNALCAPSCLWMVRQVRTRANAVAHEHREDGAAVVGADDVRLRLTSMPLLTLNQKRLLAEGLGLLAARRRSARAPIDPRVVVPFLVDIAEPSAPAMFAGQLR